MLNKNICFFYRKNFFEKQSCSNLGCYGNVDFDLHLYTVLHDDSKMFSA